MKTLLLVLALLGYIDKGNPNIDQVKVSWDGPYLTATATLNGELKGTTWLCPAITWGCYDINGNSVIGGGHTVMWAEGQCDRGLGDEQRMFTWGPVKAPQICRAIIQLTPVNGKKPLIGRAPRPLQWDN